MDPKIWRNSQRKEFLYNIKLEWIVGIPIIFPLIFLIFDLAIRDKNYSYLMTIISIIAMSAVAFYVSDKMIDSFKDTLQKKGLFGRDLNKAGIQKDKKPV